MSRLTPIMALGIVLILRLAAAPASSPPVTPCQGVLLLRNGQVLHGLITQAGDRYLVTWGDGGELSIPAGDVDMHCRDLEEVYLRQRSMATQRAGAGPHLDLAEWCFRHALLSHAADELLTAGALEPNHPRIQLLERRLQLAVSQAAAPMAATSKEPRAAGAQHADRALRQIPHAAVEKFTVHLQPLLLNRCGVSTCHGSAGNSTYRLHRPSWGKTMTQRFTERNLDATLQQINRQSPETSPLLRAAGSPHGPLHTAVFGQHEQQQLQMLTQWAKQIARQERPAAPKTITTAQANLLQAGFQRPAPAEQPPQHESDQRSSSATAMTARGDQTLSRLPDPAFAPRDPFDPELFNRRFLPAAGEDAK